MERLKQLLEWILSDIISSFLNSWFGGLLKQHSAYRFLTKSYFMINRTRMVSEGTRIHEKKWGARPASMILNTHWRSLNRPYRRFLINKILAFSPISSILEVGCSMGANLYLIAKMLPNAEIKGVDINPRAIQMGNEWFCKEGITNVKLFCCKADELRQFQDKSFDITFTNALLIYIGPDKIKKVLRDMLRITRKALILMEWHCFETQNQDSYGLGIYHKGFWKRDYMALLTQFVPENQIRVTKIPENIWPDRGWKEFGAVIEVNVNTCKKEVNNLNRRNAQGVTIRKKNH